MNSLNGCLARFGRVTAPCYQEALKSLQTLNVDDIWQKKNLYSANKNRRPIIFGKESQLIATLPVMWTQVRFTQEACRTPTLHRDYKFPNFDVYRKDEYKDVRVTTWGMGDGKPGYVYVVGVLGFVLGAYAVKGHGLHYVNYFGPAADVLAMASVEVDISKVAPGTCMTVKWRGKPLFIKNRTPHEIEVEAKTDVNSLRDPQTPEQRVQNQEWLIVIGICTHLGCVPISNTGDFVGGFYCPCHGSHFDNLGRARKGPAPLNLVVPPYVFNSPTVVTIG